MRTHCGVLLLLLCSVGVYSLPVFTNTSAQALSAAVNKADYQMMVITLLPPEGLTLEFSLDTLHVITSSSVLFDTKPYMMYYTLMTIGKSFIFTSLTLTDEGYALVKNRTQNISPFLMPVLAETNISRYPKNKFGDIAICSLDQLAKQTHHEEYYQYACVNVTTLVTSTPQMSNFIIVEDVCYIFIQIAITALVAYQFLFKMYIMRKDRKFQHVTDTTMLNPPFWQCLFPLKSKYLAKFRVWDSFSLSAMFVLISALSFVSQVFPSVWPTGPSGYNFNVFASRAHFHYPNAVIIIVGAILFVFLVIMENKQHRHKVLPKYNHQNFIVTYIVRITTSFCVVFISAVFFGLDIGFLMPTTTVSYRYALWTIFAFFYLVFLFVSLHKRENTIDRVIYDRLFKYYDNPLRQSLLQGDAESVEDLVPQLAPVHLNRTNFFVWLITIVVWTIYSVWLTAITVMTFHSGLVVTRLIRATITNMLLNLDTITTYTFCFTTVGIAYKMVSDIEAPYLKMKNAVCKARGSMHYSLLVANNERVKAGQITKEPVVYIPITWTVFIQLCKILRLPSMTYTIIMQMLLSVFTLVLFLVAANTKGENLFNGSGDSKTLFTLAIGTLIPFIPKILSFISAGTTGMDTEVFAQRMSNALKMFEKEFGEELDTTKSTWPNPDVSPTYKLIVVSKIKENLKEVTKNIVNHDVEDSAGSLYKL